VFDMAPGDNQCLTSPDRPGCSWPAQPHTEQANQVYRRVAGEYPEVRLVSMQDLVCPGGSCPVRVGGLALRHDGVHFTAPGARWFVRQLEPRLLAGVGVPGLASGPPVPDRRIGRPTGALAAPD
jgi:hypothetical protein